MKAAFIISFSLLLLFKHVVPAHAQQSLLPLDKVVEDVDTIVKEKIKETNKSDEEENNDKKNNDKNSDESESEISIPVPSITIPNIGGPTREGKLKEKDLESVSASNKDITPTPEVSITVTPSPAVIHSAKKDTKKIAAVAAVTQPIEPPKELVRSEVKGSFYQAGTLSQEINMYAMITAFVLFVVGSLLIKSELVSALLGKNGTPPLTSEQPFTIPYIGTMYK